MWGFINITPNIFKASRPIILKNDSHIDNSSDDPTGACLVVRTGTVHLPGRTRSSIITVKHFISKLAGLLGQSTSAWSMFWNSWCFGVVNVLALLMFCHGRCFGVVNVLVQSIFWQDQGFGTFSVWSALLNVTCKVFRFCIEK